MRGSLEPGAGKAAAHGATQAHELSLDPLDGTRESDAAHREHPEPDRRPADGDSAARGKDDRDGSREGPPAFHSDVELPGEAPGELLRASIHGAAGLQGLPELSRFLAPVPARRALFQVREEVGRVHELQLVIMVSLDQKARRSAIHHHLARSV